LRKYDMFVPLVAEAKMEIPYDDAVKDVLAALTRLGREYVEAIKQGIEKGGWIDVYETEGKRSGGYQWGSYSTHPFILLNYSNTINEEFTLVHELGHAMHHYFSAGNQPYVYADASIFTAEVASITNELLLMDYLLKKIKDPETKKYILNYRSSSSSARSTPNACLPSSNMLSISRSSAAKVSRQRGCAKHIARSTRNTGDRISPWRNLTISRGCGLAISIEITTCTSTRRQLPPPERLRKESLPAEKKR